MTELKKNKIVFIILIYFLIKLNNSSFINKTHFYCKVV